MNSTHENNFDFLRLLFALLVIISHSYDLSYYSGNTEILYRVTNGLLSFSHLGLIGFFSISGFLVYESLSRSKTPFNYFKKRILRIYPGFTVALVVTVLVSWIVSGYDLLHFFGNNSPWDYFFSKLSMFNPAPFIEGAFTNNPYPSEVNGSLWTVPLEVSFYILLALLFFIRSRKVLVLLILIVAIAVAVIILFGKSTIVPPYLYYYIEKPFKVFSYEHFFSFGLYFCSGVILANFKNYLYKYRHAVLITSIFSILLLVLQDVFFIGHYFIIPVVIISFGIMNTKYISNLSARIGDLSYGVYIYSFLIQQTLMNYFDFNYWQLIIFTVPISLLCGIVSWKYVEKPFLTLKKDR